MAANVMPSRVAQPYDVERVRRDFPILSREVHGRKLVYLDSAASAQRPQQVIDAVDRYEKFSHSNVHRGVHALSQEATEAFEGARTAGAETLAMLPDVPEGEAPVGASATPQTATPEPSVPPTQ